MAISNPVKPILPDQAFWAGRRVLLTGHTGFKGSWLALWLEHLGAVVRGIALPPLTRPSLYELADVGNGIDSHFQDIRDAEAVRSLIRDFAPEIVMHLAAQPLVRASYRDPLATYGSNVMGTVHVLDALRGLAELRVAVMVTTDKVYRNHEQAAPYSEEQELGGYDPYSASKAASEIIIASYQNAFLREDGIAVASARAGNVIGGGDWSEDRLIPDAVRAWQAGEVLEIRRPDAIRPWQHVLEPLGGYLRLAEQLWRQPDLAGAFNFGPDPQDAATVRQVIAIARKAYGYGEVAFSGAIDGLHEAGLLTLDPTKSRGVLGVVPVWSLDHAVSRTLGWYRGLHEGADARTLCGRDITDFTCAVKSRADHGAV